MDFEAKPGAGGASALEKRVVGAIAAVAAIALSAFQLYTSYYGPLTAMQQRIIHLCALLLLVFLLDSARDPGWKRTVCYVFAAAAVLPAVYLVVDYERIVEMAGLVLPGQVALGVLLIVLVLAATHRVLGWPLVVIALVAIVYALFGQYFPDAIAHRPYTVARLTSMLYLSTQGILGVPLGASATYIFIFVFFGALLQKTGLGDTFIQTGYAVTGRMRGGPGLACVFSSALFGTLSGSAVANVAAVGSFTIPLMKRAGYRPKVAAGIEAASSSGGQIMPPIMGASAFIMAQLTEIPYIQIAKHAIIPALFYFGSLFLAVYLEAGKYGLRRVADAEIPRLRDVLKKRGYMYVPIAVLVYLLVLGYTPLKAGFYTVVLTYALSFLSKATRIGLRELADVCVLTVRSMLPVVAACASAGILIGVLALTGLGLNISGLVVSASHGNLALALIFTAVTSLFLGMGMPTVAAYITLAVLVAPALVQMGVSLIAAHLFIFYYGLVSAITPPVALAAYAAAALAGSGPLATAGEAFRLGIVKLIVPFMFVYGPALLMIGGAGQVILAFGMGALGIFLLTASITGWFRVPLPGFVRALMLAGGLLLMYQGPRTDMAGLALGAAALLALLWLDRRARMTKV